MQQICSINIADRILSPSQQNVYHHVRMYILPPLFLSLPPPPSLFISLPLSLSLFPLSPSFTQLPNPLSQRIDNECIIIAQPDVRKWLLVQCKWAVKQSLVCKHGTDRMIDNTHAHTLTHSFNHTATYLAFLLTNLHSERYTRCSITPD